MPNILPDQQFIIILIHYATFSASAYEIRCYTTRDGLTESLFQMQGILVPPQFTPIPVEAGMKQKTTVGVPWGNQLFHYALIAIDEAGNRGQISNIVPVLVPELPSPSDRAQVRNE